ncbi:MAG TPA: heparan-alpha-glucosaminide N-acetyltransferase domain-containing protein [Bacteroidales bacterium]|nr:heparan-alpha-glucosaminide N-acetyltransferase domain-containing protein [Bacteroidales bacterium]
MAKSNTRLISLDIFRGMTVAFMIIVNTPGSWSFVYPPLRHAEWHGCTPTDLVFPSFLFIVGVSLWFSMQKYGQEINSGSVLRILRRAVTIFLTGLFLTIFPYFINRDYSQLRIMGVLQRIALAYFIGALICLAVRRQYHWIVLLAILLGYWAVMLLSGGDDPFSLEYNLARKVDISILGAGHLYKGFGTPFDPEGLLSTLTASCNVIIGYYAGSIIGKNSPKAADALRLLLIGLAGIGAGLLWSVFFPLNKPLWTSSYVLYTSGIAMGVFAVIFLITDVAGFSVWGGFFNVFGKNALFAFFLSGIWTKTMLYVVKLQSGEEKISLYNWIYQKICVPVAGNLNGSLMFAFLQLLIIWSFAFFLYRKKIFIKL